MMSLIIEKKKKKLNHEVSVYFLFCFLPSCADAFYFSYNIVEFLSLILPDSQITFNYLVVLEEKTAVYKILK